MINTDWLFGVYWQR